MSSFVEKYGKKSSGRTAEAIKESGQSAISDLAKEKKASKNNAVKSADAELIYLVKGVDAGKNAWYYVLVERLKVSLFLKALNDDIIHLEDYGKILYSAYGDHPPKEISDKIRDEYGIDDI